MFRSLSLTPWDAVAMCGFNAWSALRGLMARRALDAALKAFGSDVIGGTAVPPEP